MKKMKKWAIALVCVLGFGFLLTGCTPNSSINTNGELIYNGTSATIVGDYIFFGNGILDDFSSTDSKKESDYNSAASVAYLARLNKNIEQETQDYSPKGIANVSSEVVAHKNSFMVAVGTDIYYLAPNKNRDNSGKYYYGNSTLYRSNLSASNNGDRQIILNTEDAISTIEALKYNGKFYIVMLTGDKLIRVDLSSGKATTLLSEVTSISIPKTYQKDLAGSTDQWNGQIFYTKAKENTSLSGNNIYKISIEGGESTKVDAYGTGTYSFVGRETYVLDGKLIDEIFYSVNSVTYKMDANADSSSTSDKFYEGTFTNISKVLTKQETFMGYVFLNSSNEMGFVSNSAGVKGGVIKFMDGSKVENYQVLAVNGSQVILLTSSKIYSADISQALMGGSNEVVLSSIVTMSGIYADNALYAIDDKYVYFYAKLEIVEGEEEEDDPDAYVDVNFYLYRSVIGKTGSKNYELLGYTQDVERRSK